MEKRKLGKTDESLSVVGFGGIVVRNETPEDAANFVARAIDRGINYFDVAPAYGNAEERLGPALKPYRDQVFLACKTGFKTKEGAEKQLHESLKKLQTDHLDLYQFHGVGKKEQIENILAPGGGLEAMLEAREKGLIRYIGFSSHVEEAAIYLLEQFPFDTILFPFNWVCWHQGKVGPKILEKAQETQTGILALKALAKRPWNEGEERRWEKTWYSPVDTKEEAEIGLRFTLSRPVTSAVSPGQADLLWWACDIADRFIPLTQEEETEVARRSEGIPPIFPKD